MRVRPTLVLVTAAAMAVTGAGTLAAEAAVSRTYDAGAQPATVTAAAASGGRVIVTLRSQLPDLSIRTDGPQRQSRAFADQRGVVSEILAHGGRDVRRLVSVNAVAARVSRSEVARLRSDPAVASIQRDLPVETPQPSPVPSNSVSPRICPADPAKPLLEPEALGLLHVKSQPAESSDAATIATGAGVRIGLTGINGLAGNPNLIRPDGKHVVIDSPTPNADNGDFDGGGDEWYGDASSISGQGTVTYDFSHELPYSGLPSGCTFRIEGVAPGASLVDTGYFGEGTSKSSDVPRLESEVIAGLDRAAIKDHVLVISESYGAGSVPGQTDFSALTEANDELVRAGITVVESAGDSGVGGTVETPAYDPLIIDAGATTAFRLDSQAWGYHSWQSNQMAALSSGGMTPDGNVVDLVATGDGGEASCSPASPTCPQTTLTEAFGGTSESAPFIAGAAADVIQAYSDSHKGARPTPAMVKSILTGTARSIGAASDDQGSGLLDVGAAVRAAQQEPGSTVANASHALVPSPTQLDVRGLPNATSTHTVSLYNASSTATTITGAVSRLTTPVQVGSTVTENVSAPSSGTALPAEGAQAARSVSMTVPRGLAQLGVDMITPNPRNDAVLCLLLFDPAGRLSAISYDYSATNDQVSNNEHVAITRPMPGRWTAKIVWNNGRSHLQDPPPTPGTYRGSISVRFTGQHVASQPFGKPVSVPAHSSVSVPVPVVLPSAPGDAPESVEFNATDGARTSVPLARRTMIPGPGVTFRAQLGSSVARDFGPLKSLKITVPAGLKNMRVTFRTADTSADNTIDDFLVAPNGLDGYYDRTADATPRGNERSAPRGTASIVVADPPPGVWTIQAILDLTTSGREFEQTVTGNVAYDTSRIEDYNVPDSSRYTIASGSSTTVNVGVTNTTGVGRSFVLEGSAKDVSGSPVYIAAGSTALVSAQLTPSAAPGTKVSGVLTVEPVGSPLSALLASDEFSFDSQSVAMLPYRYTVTKA